MNKPAHTTWTLLFEPLGVLMFRDDRPFNAGQHALALSRFPLPSVFRGAVRTALFLQAGADFREKDNFGIGDGVDRELLGNAKIPESFGLRGPFVARSIAGGHEYMLPWPRDLLVTKKSERAPHRELETELLRPRPLRDAGPICLRRGSELERELSPLGMDLPWTAQVDVPKPPKVRPWFTAKGGGRYVGHQRGTLRGLHEREDWIDQEEFLAEEVRVGIARDTQSIGGSLVAAESMLYTLIAWRMHHDFRFAVEVDLGSAGDGSKRLGTLLEGLDGGLVRLGGRSGHARVQLLKHGIAPSWAQLRPAEADPSSKLWLWTPGLFDPQELLAEPVGFRGALGEALRLGGFDMVRQTPRPLRGAIDKGAVLWFSGLDHEALDRHQRGRAEEHDLPLTSYGHGHWSNA